MVSWEHKPTVPYFLSGLLAAGIEGLEDTRKVLRMAANATPASVEKRWREIVVGDLTPEP